MPMSPRGPTSTLWSSSDLEALALALVLAVALAPALALALAPALASVSLSPLCCVLRCIDDLPRSLLLRLECLTLD